MVKTVFKRINFFNQFLFDSETNFISVKDTDIGCELTEEYIQDNLIFSDGCAKFLYDILNYEYKFEFKKELNLVDFMKMINFIRNSKYETK